MMAGLREWKGDGKKWMELKYSLDAESIGLERIKDVSPTSISSSRVIF